MSRSKRRGYFLVEVMMTMTVGAIIAGIAGALLAEVLRAHRGKIDGAERMTSLFSLAENFRRDVRAARSAAAEEGALASQAIMLDMGEGRTVRYLIEEGTVRRAESEGGTVRRRESFAPHGIAALRIERSGRLAAVVLDFSPPRATEGDGSKPKARELRIEAALGADTFPSTPSEAAP